MIRLLITGIMVSFLLCSTSYALNNPPDFRQKPLPCEARGMNTPLPMHDPEIMAPPEIEFTEEQQEQIKTIQTKAAEQAKQLTKKLQGARKATMDMERKEQFSEDDFRKAAKNVAGIEVEIMVLKAKTTVLIRSLLTEEQKNQLSMAGLRSMLKPLMPEPPEKRIENPAGAGARRPAPGH